MIHEAIAKVVEGGHLSEVEATIVMEEIMEGQAPPALVGSLLTALRMRGETPAEVTGFARTMRAKSVRVTPRRSDVVDTCGTGGGHLHTFNISTTAALVVAGAGVGVAKHGNRAMTSRCGSADVLEALGVRITCSPERVAACIDEAGIGFMFAQAHHPAMKHVAPIRRELRFRTVFNILGPLTNPAGASAQVTGVFHPDLTELLATALRELGSRRAFVVYGLDGLDEISTIGATKVTELRDGVLHTYELRPGDIGLRSCSPSDLAAGEDPAANAALTCRVLEGEAGPRRDIVLLNAAAALTVAGAVPSLRDGLGLAAESIDSGRAAASLARLREASHVD